MMILSLLMGLSMQLTNMIKQKHELLLSQQALISQMMAENAIFYENYQKLDGNCEIEHWTFSNYEIYLGEDKTIEKVVER